MEGFVFTPRRSRLGDARPAKRQVSAPRRGRLSFLIALAALSFLWAGADLLYRHFTSEVNRPFRSASGWMLVGLAVVQIRIAWEAWRRRDSIDLSRFGLRSAYVRWFLVGPVVCYLSMMAVGPERHARYLFRAAIGLWFTVMLLPLVLPPRPFAGRSWAWLNWPAPRWAGNTVFTLLTLAVAAELALRTYASVAGQRVEAAHLAQQCVLPPGSDFRGAKVNALGYWDDEFQARRRAGVYRIAVLGDELTLSGSAETNFLNRIERRLTDIEIYNFGVPQTGPREYAATLAQHVLSFQPDLVVTCLSLSDDVTGRLPLPSQFDWSSLHLYQLLRGSAPEQPLWRDAYLSAPREQEAFLRDAAGRLAVCRAPLDDRMRRRWQQTFGHLSEMARVCRRSDVPVVLLAAPSDLQLDARLRETLCRRLGRRPEEIDIELPQRQLSQYARQHDLPLIDLFPHFRNASQGVYGRHASQWNEQGNELAANVLGDWLQSRYAARLARAK
jgi:hypothetical protein